MRVDSPVISVIFQSPYSVEDLVTAQDLIVVLDEIHQKIARINVPIMIAVMMYCFFMVVTPQIF